MKTNIKLLVIDWGKIGVYLKNTYFNWCQINFFKKLFKYLHTKVQTEWVVDVWILVKLFSCTIQNEVNRKYYIACPNMGLHFNGST
jgi:hypothetical protein